MRTVPDNFKMPCVGGKWRYASAAAEGPDEASRSIVKWNREFRQRRGRAGMAHGQKLQKHRPSIDMTCIG